MVLRSKTGKRPIRRTAMKKRTAVKRRAATRLATVGMVKKLIHRNTENKVVGFHDMNQFNSTINTTADAYNLIPQLAQGVTDNTRIGNRITPRGLLVTLNVYINPLETVTARSVFLPRILILTQKSTDGYAPSLAPDFSRLLEYGAGEQAFNGDLVSYRAPVNTDAFRVIKDIKTKLSIGSQEQNMDVISRTYKIWVPCPKTLTYVDGQNYPQNFLPFICLGWADGQGQPFGPTFTPIVMDWTSTLYFEDA